MLQFILCNLWGLLAGALLGWLASWLLGRGRLAASTVAAAPGIDYAAAKAAGFVVSGPDNLEIIEGVGPKIAHLLRSNGVGTFALLAAASQSALKDILKKGGPAYDIANPETWPEQASLAAQNRWQDLRNLMERLDAGVRR
jgi:predicted flap endonuclease-1-like 5' DNA nuclease